MDKITPIPLMGYLAPLVIAGLGFVIIALSGYDAPTIDESADLGSTKDLTALTKDGAYSFGKYLRPFPSLSYGQDESFFRLKRWSFLSFTSEDYLFSVAVANLNYVANTFFYLVDTKTELLGFSDSSISGCTSWKSGWLESRIFGTTLDINMCGSSTEVELQMSYSSSSGTLKATAKIDLSGDSLAVLYPINERQPAYTHKAVGCKATGSLVVNDKAQPVLVGGLDWTYSLARRITKWKWCSFSHVQPDGTIVGVNLSDEVYVDKKGISQENGIWINHKLIDLIEPIQWDIEEASGKWHIYTTNSSLLDLHFQTQGTREEHLHLGVIASDFIQPYGLFDGTVAGYAITKAAGVVENHYAKW